MSQSIARKKLLTRNLLLYRLLLIFVGNGLTTSAIYFFLTITKGLNPAEALFLVGLAALSMALAEVPTGIIADKFSRKNSIIIGIIILALSCFGILFATGFWPLLVLMVLQGIGGSFISGADDALLYDSLKEEGLEKEFKSIYNFSQSMEYVSFAITVLLGGLLASVNLYYPVVGNLVLLCISAIIASQLTEPLSTKRGEELEHVGYFSHMERSIKVVFSRSGLNTGLLPAFISFGIISAAFKSTKNILSPILSNYGFNVSTISIIITGMILVKSIGAFIAGKISRNRDIKKETIIALFIFISGLLAITYLPIPVIKLIIFIVILSLDAIILSNLNTIVNENIASFQRSTILSLLSVFGLSSKMLFLTSLGWIIDLYSIELSLLFTAIWLGVPMSLLFLVRTKTITYT